jgi:hypothetical protein
MEIDVVLQDNSSIQTKRRSEEVMSIAKHMEIAFIAALALSAAAAYATAPTESPAAAQSALSSTAHPSVALWQVSKAPR